MAIQSTGEIVGCVQFRPNPGGPFSLAVLPQFRDKGIGRQLMIKVEQHAVGLKYRTLKTGIVNFRERQLFPYYQRLGYVKTNKTHDLEGTPYHLIEIHKIIS